jgi:type IV secretion system protein VirB2
MNIASSLLEPIPHSVIEAASIWIVALLSGSLVTTLCVVAVATLGLLMMTGRIQIRAGVQVVIGCFLLFSAALLADDLQTLARSNAGTAAKFAPVAQDFSTNLE